MALSREERLTRKCEAEKIQQSRISQDPKLVKENEKHRERYHKKRNEKETVKQKADRQMKWRLEKLKYRKVSTDKESEPSERSTRSDSMKRIVKVKAD